MKTAPTIGRVVLYWPGEHDNGNNNTGTDDQPMAATVSYVWNDNMVNLAIVDHDGKAFGKTSVIMADEDTNAEAGQCEWMAYQKEQAEK